jgi:hypothetical protein
VGGFSTDCLFGNDTQFLLRAFFQTPIRNVPRFLYVRREHADALTIHPDTGMANPVRLARNTRWRDDFAAVLSGAMPLLASSLVATRGPDWRPVQRAPSGV